MSEPSVTTMFAEHRAVAEHLAARGEVSFANIVEDNFRKSLLLAAASYFEHKLTFSVMEFALEQTNNVDLIPSVVHSKAINRQYHTWFAWDTSNANQFFKMFGDNFLAFMKLQVKEDEKLERSIAAFLSIGLARNRLAHNDFASFTLEKTSQEVFEEFELGRYFVDKVPELLRKCASLQRQSFLDAESARLERRPA